MSIETYFDIGVIFLLATSTGRFLAAAPVILLGIILASGVASNLFLIYAAGIAVGMPTVLSAEASWRNFFHVAFHTLVAPVILLGIILASGVASNLFLIYAAGIAVGMPTVLSAEASWRNFFHVAFHTLVYLTSAHGVDLLLFDIPSFQAIVMCTYPLIFAASALVDYICDHRLDKKKWVLVVLVNLVFYIDAGFDLYFFLHTPSSGRVVTVTMISAAVIASWWR